MCIPDPNVYFRKTKAKIIVVAGKILTTTIFYFHRTGNDGATKIPAYLGDKTFFLFFFSFFKEWPCLADIQATCAISLDVVACLISFLGYF